MFSLLPDVSLLTDTFTVTASKPPEQQTDQTLETALTESAALVTGSLSQEVNL